MSYFRSFSVCAVAWLTGVFCWAAGAGANPPLWQWLVVGLSIGVFSAIATCSREKT